MPCAWIRVGGVLFATFGLQYLGTAWLDWARAAGARRAHRERVADVERSMERQREGAAAQAEARGRAQPDGGGGAAAAAAAAFSGGAFSDTAAVVFEDERRHSNLLYSSTQFYTASVWSRLALALSFTALVVSGVGAPGLLVLAGVNLVGAVSMALALRKQWMMHMGLSKARS